MIETEPTAHNETGRLEAFSDGVFAIAITLLVLDLKVPRELAEGQTLASALAGLWPAYFGFLTSFATIGIMWINHHRLFQMIGRCDERLLVFNGLLLLGVTFVPFPTGVVAEYVQKPESRTAALFYGGTFFVIAIFFGLLWRHVSKDRRLIDPRVPQEAVDQVTRAYRIGPASYLLTALAALISGELSMALNLALAVFWALPGKFQMRLLGG